MKIDQTNINIIRELKEGKKPFKKIAGKLGITENTVRSRVLKLQEEGVLEFFGLVDPAKLPGHRSALWALSCLKQIWWKKEKRSAV